MAISFVGYATASGTGGTLNVNINGTLTGGIGSSPQQGDLIIAIHGSAYNTLLTMSASGNNSGAYTTEVAAFRGNDTWDANLCISRQFAGATPDTTVSCTKNLTSTQYGGNAIVLVYRGVDATTPMDVATTTASGINGCIADSPSITPTTSGALIIAVGNGAQNPTSTAYTTPSGMTGIVSLTNDGTVSDNTLIASSYAWTSGAYNPAVVGGGDSDASSSWAAVTMALRPAATGGGPYTITASAGAFTLAGVSATLRKSKNIAASAGAFALAGNSATLLKTKRIEAQPGAFALTGVNAALLKSKRIEAQPGAFTLTGVDATLKRGFFITAQPGAFTLSGVDATLHKDKRIEAQSGGFVLAGNNATLSYSGAPPAAQDNFWLVRARRNHRR